MNMSIKILACFLVGAIINGCDTSSQVSTSGAEQVAPSTIKKNSRGKTVEQQNIDDRINVTTDPTKVMWIHLIALDGNIIRRMPIRNKVTSSGKRLEPVHAADVNGLYPDSPFTYSLGGSSYWETDEFIQADGTYGSSDPYIYWFDPMSRYHQWGTAGGLGYLLTDYPIDLQNPIDEITGMYNAHQAATKWQEEEEAKLRAKENR